MDDIKMYLKEISCKNVGKIHVCQDMFSGY
jgi:hypothetical protein